MVFEDFYDFAWLPFGWLLKLTWLHFWTFLAAKLAPSWHQIAPKIDLKNDQKIISFWIASGSTFARFWPPTWHLYRGSTRLGFGAFWLLEPSWGQDGPKTSPRDPPRQILVDFGTQLGGFWDPTWWILDPKLLDFGWILYPTWVIFGLLGWLTRWLVGWLSSWLLG